jgi:hypothetical protein
MTRAAGRPYGWIPGNALLGSRLRGPQIGTSTHSANRQATMQQASYSMKRDRADWPDAVRELVRRLLDCHPFRAAPRTALLFRKTLRVPYTSSAARSLEIPTSERQVVLADDKGDLGDPKESDCDHGHQHSPSTTPSPGDDEYERAYDSSRQQEPQDHAILQVSAVIAPFSRPSACTLTAVSCVKRIRPAEDQAPYCGGSLVCRVARRTTRAVLPSANTRDS